MFFFVGKHIRDKAASSLMTAKYASECISGYAARGWLKNYWIENCDDMDLIYDTEYADLLELYVRKNIPGYISAKSVTPSQISVLSEDVQKRFAELCYSELSFDFDRIKRNYECTYLCAFMIVGDECLYMISGCDEGEERLSQGGDIYELGVRVSYKLGEFSLLDDILSGREIEDEEKYVLFKTEHETDVNAYTPVYDDDGSVAMVVTVDHNVTNILRDAASDMLAIVIVMLILLIMLTVAMNVFLFRFVIRPIKKEEMILAEYINEKDANKTVKELSEIKTDNEIETLAESFSFMASELDRYIGEIRTVTAENERIVTELELASRIQLSALPLKFPAFPDRHEFDVYASMTPAKEVGGDFYDFFLVDDDHLVLVIADVSGKGVPAALFMMMSKMLINTYSCFGGSPSEIFGSVNERICENNADDMFVTVWLGLLEISTGKMTCCNAGHEYPAIKKADGQFSLLKDKHGLFIGVVANYPYSEYEIVLDPGDTLFVYTDGVPEATSASLELFGEDRMLNALNSAGSCSLEELLKSVKSAADEFTGEAPQFDDLTMLAIRYNGTQEQQD